MPPLSEPLAPSRGRLEASAVASLQDTWRPRVDNGLNVREIYVGNRVGNRDVGNAFFVRQRMWLSAKLQKKNTLA